MDGRDSWISGIIHEWLRAETDWTFGSQPEPLTAIA